jgi:hypothetical protein
LSCFVPNLKVSVVIKIIKIKNHTFPWQSMEFVHSILDYPLIYE